MKVLIVDDEMLVRAGIKSSINWDSLGYTVVGEADNGENALRMVEDLKPDIILLDIKMPVKDGIDVLKEIKSRNAICKVIVLSCHDEFEYVKEAMKHGALDYILKHRINTDDLVGILNSAKDIIIKEQVEKGNYEKLKKEVEKSRELVKKDYLLKLVKGSALIGREQEENLDGIGINITERNLCCIVFEVDDFERVKQRYDQYNNELLQFSVSNITREVLSVESETEFFQYDNNMYVVLSSNHSEISENIVHARNSIIIRKISDALSNFLNINVSFGVSDIYNGLDNTCREFGKALKALSQKFVHYQNFCFYYREIFESRMLDCSPRATEMESRIREYARAKDYSSVLAMLDEYLDLQKCETFVDTGSVKAFLKALADQIHSDMPSAKDFHGSAIEGCSNIDEAWALFESVLKKNCLSVNDKDGPCSYLVKEAVRFINSNYMGELCLKAISDHLGVTESYISRLFSREMQVTITGYINSMRIEKAKELLKNIKLKNYEIAEMSGFKTVIHFDMVFKKLVGCTPTEYRNRMASLT